MIDCFKREIEKMEVSVQLRKMFVWFLSQDYSFNIKLIHEKL